MGAATNTAFAGPWGVSFAANLTPDKETGLGAWTEEMFIATMRTQRHQGKGRALLPPMPASMIANLNDEDLKALFAYLQSLTPVRNRVPTPVDPPEAQQ
jgi:mono/diheme cytochrome c family protein